MNHTYALSGMTCGNCVAKVKSELLKNPDVTSGEVTLDPPQAVISVNRHLSLDSLQSAVSRAGSYTIAVDKNQLTIVMTKLYQLPPCQLSTGSNPTSPFS